MVPEKQKLRFTDNKQQIIIDESIAINKGLKNIKYHK